MSTSKIVIISLRQFRESLLLWISSIVDFPYASGIRVPSVPISVTPETPQGEKKSAML